MKNYKEITSNLLLKREQYVAQQYTRKRRIVTIATSLSCFCAVALAGIGLINNGIFNKIPTANTENQSKNSESHYNILINSVLSDTTSKQANDEDISQSQDNSSNAENEYSPCVFTLDYWLNNNKVVWKNSDIQKGNSPSGLSVELGNTLVDDELAAEFEKNSDSTVYAIMVDFSSMLTDDLIYEGKTLSDWNRELQKLVSQGLNEEAKQIAQKISKAKEQFYFAQLDKFRNKFEKVGLGVYNEKHGTTIDNCIFYTFATKSHLEAIKCNPDEAFIFSLAVRFK